MGFLNFGKKKKDAMPGQPPEQSMTMPPNPARDNMLPSLSDEKLDGLKLPELPDLNELGIAPEANMPHIDKPMNQAPRRESRPSPAFGNNPVPPMPITPPAPNNRMRPGPATNKNQPPLFPGKGSPASGMQSQNPHPLNRPPQNPAPMHPAPVPRRPQLPAQKMPKPMRIPRKLKDPALDNMHKPPSSEDFMKNVPKDHAGKKLDPFEALKATSALGNQKDPALLDDFLSDEVPESVPYEDSRSSNFSESGEFFIKGEEYRTIVEAVNSVASIKTDQINTSESFNFSHSMNDKFERIVEKIKNKIISMDELLFE